MTPSTDTAWPASSDLTLGVQPCLDFLQRQATLTLATATSWVLALTTVPVAVAGGLKAAEQLLNTRTEHLAAQARAAANMTSAQYFSPGPAGAADQPKAPLTNIFDEIVELVVDADIMAYSR